jgi:hypothetical protein
MAENEKEEKGMDRKIRNLMIALLLISVATLIFQGSSSAQAIAGKEIRIVIGKDVISEQKMAPAQWKEKSCPRICAPGLKT